MFIARKKELEILQNSLKACGNAVMIYGKRKVGKTTLIKEYLKSGRQSIYYECIKASLEENVAALTAEMVRAGVLPSMVSFKTFIDLFAFLNTLNAELNIVIDEYPYLKQTVDPALVDSTFQNIIDNRMKNICLIISGSHVSMMKSLLEEGNSLYGRFSAIIRLSELSYADSAQFYPQKNPYDKIAFYSVFGGSPFINENIDPSKSLKTNIVNTILNENSSVYIYADNLLLSEYPNRINTEKICYALGNGKKRYGEIQKFLNMDKTGNLNKQLGILTDMELVRKSNPVNRQDDPKKTMYDIRDNLLRFYYKFVYRNKSALQMLGAERFYEELIKPELTVFIAHRFEEICRDYFSAQAASDTLSGVRNIGSLYYDDPVNKTNGEFDVALHYSDGYAVFEVKYHKNRMTVSEINKEVFQIMSIPGLKINKIGFISANGFEQQDSKYVYLDGNDIYK